MNNIEIQSTSNTPYVNLDAMSGNFLFEGRSISEDPGDFYLKIMEWIDTYFKEKDQNTIIEFKMEYINSGSSKYILELLRIVSGHYQDGRDCQVIWYYEKDDESIKDLGILYKNTLNLPIEIKIMKI